VPRLSACLIGRRSPDPAHPPDHVRNIVRHQQCTVTSLGKPYGTPPDIDRGARLLRVGLASPKGRHAKARHEGFIATHRTPIAETHPDELITCQATPAPGAVERDNGVASVFRRKPPALGK